MDAFLLSFGVVFLAEVGDKSLLMALVFASLPGDHGAHRRVVGNAARARGSVLLGSVFALALPTTVIQIVAGLAFFGFAAWTLRGDKLGEADQGTSGDRGTERWRPLARAVPARTTGRTTVLTTRAPRWIQRRSRMGGDDTRPASRPPEPRRATGEPDPFTP